MRTLDSSVNHLKTIFIIYFFIIQGSELSHLLPEEKRDELKKTFQTLDTDADGYVLYACYKTYIENLKNFTTWPFLYMFIY